ncbi:MAG: hypothetical protein VX834_13915 [Myxococcota bacterium]|nr:hypothetical protein [Myxococcota bacterium]
MISTSSVSCPVIPTFAQPVTGCESSANQAPSATSDVVDTLEVRANAATLPPKVAAAKRELLALAKANTTNLDGLAETRAQMEPHLKVLGDYFQDLKTRGVVTDAKEQSLTTGVWRSRWFDDADVGDVGPLKLNRDRVWQIVKPVEEGSDKSYFYNAFEYNVEVGGFLLGKARGFLRGMFGFSKSEPVATGSRLGVDLEFTYNGLKPFGFTKGDSVAAIVDDVEDGGFSSVGVPGPIGVTGRLRNLYIDEDIRIAEGVQLTESDINARDVYIQERSDRVD